MIKKILIGIGIFIALIVVGSALVILFEFIRPPVLVNRAMKFENSLYIPPLLEAREQNGKRLFELTLQ